MDSVGNIGISYVNATDRDLKFAFAPTAAAIPVLSPGATGLLLALLFALAIVATLSTPAEHLTP